MMRPNKAVNICQLLVRDSVRGSSLLHGYWERELYSHTAAQKLRKMIPNGGPKTVVADANFVCIVILSNNAPPRRSFSTSLIFRNELQLITSCRREKGARHVKQGTEQWDLPCSCAGCPTATGNAVKISNSWVDGQTLLCLAGAGFNNAQLVITRVKSARMS